MFDFIKQIIDFVLHIDKHLIELVNQYHQWTYLIIFAIIFIETGLVIMPFLPGDSLLFASGALCSAGTLDIKILLVGVYVFAVLGDNCNYFVGQYLSKKASEKKYKYIKKDYLDRTEHFYEKHGGKALIMARFMPILRTFAPFVAGAGKMTYKRFFLFCLIGNFLWVNLFLWAGYLFADNEFVKKNFSLVIIAIILVSVIPVFVAWIRNLSRKKI